MPSVGPQLPPHLANIRADDSHSGDETGTSIGPAPPAQVTVPRPVVGLQARPQPPSASSSKPSAPPVPSFQTEDDEDDGDDYVPELPPDLLPSRSTLPQPSTRPPKRVQGPSFPSSRVPAYNTHDDEDDDDDDYGPMPLPAGVSLVQKDAVSEFMEKEERRRKALEEANKPKTLQRDEWMLKPPTSSDLLASLDPTKLTKGRRFAASSKPVGSRDVDSSLWTETPAERQQRLADEIAGKRRRAENAEPAVDEAEELERTKRRKREAEVRRGVQEHTLKNRGGTLVDQHRTASSTAPKDAEEGPPVIWDHGRDMALSGRLLDDRSREKMIKEARGLGDRFGTGSKGGFL